MNYDQMTDKQLRIFAKGIAECSISEEEAKRKLIDGLGYLPPFLSIRARCHERGFEIRFGGHYSNVVIA